LPNRETSGLGSNRQLKIAASPSQQPFFSGEAALSIGHLEPADTFTPSADVAPHQRLFINSPGFDTNEAWAKEMWQLVQQASSKVQHDEYQTAEQILDSFSKSYQKLTGKGNWFNTPHSHRPPWELSKISGPGTKQTSIIRRAPYLDRIRAMAQSGLSGEAAQKEAKKMNLYLPQFQPLEYLHFQEQDGILLTATVQGKHPQGGEMLGWLYVDAETSRKCLEKVETLTQEVLSYKGNLTPLNQKKAVKAIAQIHWWMIHSISFNGGTAGLTDMLSKTLFDAIGMKTSPWKKGIVPDMEVFVNTLDRYTEKYPQFFEKPPMSKDSNHPNLSQEGDGKESTTPSSPIGTLKEAVSQNGLPSLSEGLPPSEIQTKSREAAPQALFKINFFSRLMNSFVSFFNKLFQLFGF
ncbi:MAG: hypothetical protein K2X66_15515, partial [Cyanobacteria bacterium]|nr:hypothetical protein [Cyanobacteriota bacterium]